MGEALHCNRGHCEGNDQVDGDEGRCNKFNIVGIARFAPRLFVDLGDCVVEPEANEADARPTYADMSVNGRLHPEYVDAYQIERAVGITSIEDTLNGLVGILDSASCSARVSRCSSMNGIKLKVSQNDLQ